MNEIDALTLVFELFDQARDHCSCGAIDIGVGIQHEPSCGSPTPEDIAEAILAAYRQGLQDAHMSRIQKEEMP